MFHHENEIFRADKTRSFRDSKYYGKPEPSGAPDFLLLTQLLRPGIFFNGPVTDLNDMVEELPLTLRAPGGKLAESQFTHAHWCLNTDTAMRISMIDNSALPMMR
jgi:hypothetical protein